MVVNFSCSSSIVDEMCHLYVIVNVSCVFYCTEHNLYLYELYSQMSL
jgi:hypothetical protein